VVYLLHSADGTHKDTQLDPRIAQVIKQFESVFESPKVLPPSRSCNHTIPLLLGAQPVFIWPYRYAPTVKVEIERQVSEMLNSGIIRHNTSSFSSPVLLVHKKDESWRFCVDFRHLNALMVKRKYLIPIIDEFLDELYGAS
jgi:hypothetical protein